MENQILIIQQKINQYCLYVKRFILSHLNEYDTEKIHGRYIYLVLKRLISVENEQFKRFFNDEKTTIELQLMRYLANTGEIIHVGKNYYILPPVRTITLPGNQNVSISSLTIFAQNSFGLATRDRLSDKIILTTNEYIYRPELPDFLNAYLKLISDNHDVIPDKIYKLNENGKMLLIKHNQLQEGGIYILYYERRIGEKMKPERYLSRWIDGKWFVKQIQKNHLKRVILSILHHYKFIQTYSIDDKGEFGVLNLSNSLPLEEQAILNLIATPICSSNPKQYYFHMQEKSKIEVILSKCNLQIGG